MEDIHLSRDSLSSDSTSASYQLIAEGWHLVFAVRKMSWALYGHSVERVLAGFGPEGYVIAVYDSAPHSGAFIPDYP